MDDQPEKTQYGLSSIGTPNASMPELLSIALNGSLDFVEIRGLGGTLDLPAYFAASPIPDRSNSLLPPVRLLATNLKLIEATEKEIQDFLCYVDLAVMLRAPYLRVFGGLRWGDLLSNGQLEQAARIVEECRSAIREKSARCEILIETHSAFSCSDACLRLNEFLDEPLNILWDSHHTWRDGGESPAQTWDKIGPRVRHIHFSDSRLRTEGGYEVVLPGLGEYPVELFRKLLADVDYAYGVSLEWEKLWHPELPDISVALNEFRRLLTS